MEREEFPGFIREQVKSEQHNRCATCGQKGHLTIHHKEPLCMGGESVKENAAGLCRGKKTLNCHDIVDFLTIEQNVPFEQIMIEGIEYKIQEYREAMPRGLQRIVEAREKRILQRENYRRNS